MKEMGLRNVDMKTYTKGIIQIYNDVRLDYLRN